MDRTNFRVALVAMPFGSTRWPSIQLGQLEGILRQRRFLVRSHYLNLLFAARIGWDRYERLADMPALLVGEWLFAEAAFRDQAPPAEAYFAAKPDRLASLNAITGCGQDDLLSLRQTDAPAFLDRCVQAVAWRDYRVVGFTSTFEQHCASLALARRIKERWPETIIVFGGANLEDDMGVESVRAFPWIDYAVNGEGDEVFPDLLERIATGRSVDSLPGVLARDGAKTRSRPVTNLDAYPVPAFDSYFATLADLDAPELVDGATVSIPFEGSRGCWWGQKHHCTFCGLNGLGMGYRRKSAHRIAETVTVLSARHQRLEFRAVDNILDHRHIEELFAPVAESRLSVTFFYEAKANLNQSQLKQLARAGVRSLQPGIESLSTAVLRLMRKGTTAIQNVRLLKWCRYYGIDVAWNTLYGFPGETDADNWDQIAIMRTIPHLQPPSGAGRFRLNRFSPYFNDPGSWNIENVRAKPAYRAVYPATVDVEKLAYFFDYDLNSRGPEAAIPVLDAIVEQWQARWLSVDRPFLHYARSSDRITVTDGRDEGPPRVLTFAEPDATIYDLCGPSYRRAAGIHAYLTSDRGLTIDLATVQRALDRFVAAGLMLDEGGRYLSLAIPVNPNW